MQHVIEHDELARRMAALAPGVECVHPGQHPLIELGGATHRVIDALAALEQPREDVVDIPDRERIVGCVVGHDAVGTCPCPIPGLAFGVALAAEHQELAVLASRNEHGDCLRFRKSREIEKIAVGPIVVQRIAAANTLARRRQHCDAVSSDRLHQVAAASLQTPSNSGQRLP